MDLFVLSHVNKIYKIDKKRTFYALRNVTFSLPYTGFVSIVGKSGCGKSTCLNMLSLIDAPSSGNVYFQNKDINKFNDNKKSAYLLNEIGIIFQNFHLIEDEDVIYNIMLPYLISGHNKKEAHHAAEEILKKFQIKKDLYKQKCGSLSGGEKQRIAILRSLINNPLVLVCDEPTGALDKTNSKIVMDLLKNISKEKLVVMVSHNKKLVDEYSDRIIEMCDGKIIRDNYKITTDIKCVKNEKKYAKRTSNWLNHISFKNIKRRFKRNIFTILSIVFGLVSTYMVIGFSLGKDKSVINESYKQFDYGSATLSKETSKPISNSVISISQTFKPSLVEKEELMEKFDQFFYVDNLDAFISPVSTISVGENLIENVTCYPIYSFEDQSIDKQLLIRGKFPFNNNFAHVVINKPAYELILNQYKINPLNLSVRIKNQFETIYYPSDELEGIKDTFILDTNLTIDGVVDEFSFLDTPKIFYSYIGAADYLNSITLNNLSNFVHRDISWLSRIEMISANDPLSSYSYRLFLKDSNNKDYLKKVISTINAPFVLTSGAFIRESSLIELVNAADSTMKLFLVVILLGTIFIIGILSFFCYNEDKKRSAILSAIGARKDDIFSIYINESLFYVLIGYLISLLITIPITNLANSIISKHYYFHSIINLSWDKFLEVPFFIPIIVFITCIFVALIATLFPMVFSKKISIKDELQNI